MDDKTWIKRVASYKQYKLNKTELREKFPRKYREDESLELLGKMYLFLKEHHFDLPKFTKSRLKAYPKGKSISNSAYCFKKNIKFAKRILNRRADVTSILNDKNWQIYEGTFMLFELLTHEMAHFRISGHNKRFYYRQKQLFNTAINGMISGEYYTSNSLYNVSNN